MKKKLTALFVATILLLSTTFAKTANEPSKQLKNEFTRIFAQATEVKWEEVADNLYKVSFLEGTQYLTAFFNAAGKMEAISRNISTNTLPLILEKGIQDKLSASWVTECFEIFGKNGTEYYLTIENANETTLYHANSSDWDVYKKTKRN